MTNNPTIDGVSRELLHRMRQRLIDKGEIGDFGPELFQLLNVDAPAFDRQAQGALIRYRELCGHHQGGREIWHKWSDWQNVTVSFAESKLDQTRDLASVQYEVRWLYADSLEVAALQSTIAQLRQHKNDYMEAAEETRKALVAGIARLEARIAELESGRGEIAGFRYRANGDWEWMDESPFADGRTHYKLGGEELQPLYAVPPAPVAVLLPDRKTEYATETQGAYLRGWNACLDATAALNNKPSTEVSQ